ncbi:MAG: gluconeogenesis factor YvcK family protein [Candidatus Nanopelagicaceae bacterium]
MKVVSFGGGHGLAATLRALRQITPELTAIVTVADNGGSSGRLRKEFNALPPGDLRMALAALCGDDEWGRNWADLMQYRFTSDGDLNGHALGNLLLAALWDRDGDPIQGLERVGALLKVVGRVLPMSLEPLDIEGTFKSWQGTQVIRGQKEVAIGKGSLENLTLIPPDAKATSQGLGAIKESDWLTFGPGSWFSSVLPHLLLDEQRSAILQSRAKRIFLLNLDANPSASGDEYAGVSAAEHLHLLQKFAPTLNLDFALADQSIVASTEQRSALSGIVKEMGGELVVADLATAPGSNHHDPRKLISAFRNIFAGEMLR